MSDKTALPTVEERCGTCRYLAPDADNPGLGWCYRFPPVFTGAGEDPFDDGSWHQPVVWRTSRCGEWRPKPQHGTPPAKASE